MKRETVNSIADDILKHHTERETAPETRAPHLIDLSHYTDYGQFEAERQRLFREMPLMMGFSVDLPENGSVKTNDYLDTPILLVRDREGVVRAFANMCRHRGARLVSEPSCTGRRKSLSCPYHGWIYGLNGQLKSVQGENLFGVIDYEMHGLIELPSDERHGMIFVRPIEGEAVAIDRHLGAELSQELSGWAFETLHFVDATTIDTPSNWKVQTDTFLENYHVESLHGSTIGPLALSGYTHHKYFGFSQRMSFAAKSILRLPDMPIEDRNGHKHLSIVYMIFPNIFIIYGALWVQYFEIYPGRTIDTQRTRFALYCRKPMVTDKQKAGGRAYFDLNMEFVPSEDYLMGQQVTRAIMSGAEKRHMFGFAEQALVHFHQAVRSVVGLDPNDLFVRSA